MTAANPSVAMAQVLVDELVRCGMTDAVIAPGSRSAALAMALDADARVRLHVRIDERSAGFLALGLARGSGRPAAVLCTSGTAAANLHPAVLEAHEARVPLLVLTADRPPELRATAANQTTDQIKLYGDAVRWFCEVGVAEDIPQAVPYWRATACRAWAEAFGGPAGPVHLNLAFREPLTPEGPGFGQDLSGRVNGAPWVRRSDSRAVLDQGTIDELARQLQSVERGMLYAGDGASAQALTALAQRLGWPVVAEPTSGARVGPHAIRTAALLAQASGFASDFAHGHAPDLVLRAGRPQLSRPMAALAGAATTQILVDPDGAWLDPHRSIDWIVRADPALLTQQLLPLLAQREAGEWWQAWAEADRKVGAAIDQLLDAEGLSEPRVARDTAAALPAGATLVVGSSMPIRDLDQVMTPRDDVRVVGNRGVSGIDGFVSTAVGVALASSAPTVALCGDLSLLHDANGLLGGLLGGPLGGLQPGPGGASVDLTLVVVNNDGGGIFSFLPQAQYPHGFETVFGTPHGVDLAALAQAYGASHHAATDPDDVTKAVASAGTGTGLRIVEVRTDRAENVALHRRLRDTVAAALA